MFNGAEYAYIYPISLTNLLNKGKISAWNISGPASQPGSQQGLRTLLLVIVTFEGHHCQVRGENRTEENIKGRVDGCLLTSGTGALGWKNFKLLVKS